jgi:hypothetical protein
MDEIQTPGGSSPSLDAPAHTPDAVALREEVGKIMRDPMWGKDPALVAKRDKLYADKYGSGTVELDDSMFHFSEGGASAHTNESPAEAEARARNEVITAPLRTEWGPEYEKNFADAGAEYRVLSAGLEEPVSEMGSRIRLTYGPKGEAALVKFLHALAKIKKGG